MKQIGFATGSLYGLLSTAILTSIFYIGHRLAGLPFAPFDLFDWITRRLPGAVVTAGIDTMVAGIARLGIGPTASVAKTVEQTLAIGAFLVLGALGGGIVLLIARRTRDERARIVGGIVGALAGVALAVISLRMGADSPVAAAVWIFALLLAWGIAAGRSFARLGGGREGPEANLAYAEPIDRRTFLVRLGAATAVMTVGGAAVAAIPSRRSARDAAMSAGARPWSADHPLPNASARVQPVRGTRPELTPVPEHYRIDINTRPPTVEADSWRLHVGGLVDRTREISLADLRALEPTHLFVTLSCISNRVGGDLIGTTRWTGVSLAHLLPELGLTPAATHLRIASADGYHEVVALDLVRADPRVMLCYEWDGLPLPPEHGFPLRIYIPDRYGMKQPKWITSIEAIDDWRPGYWVERGWDREAIVESTSVIDTVETDSSSSRSGGGATVPIGGIAYAGARGISRVEVRVDDGEWAPAALRDPISDLTWVLWRYEWPFAEGRHTLVVRCFDGSGAMQEVQPSPPHPDGATGLDSVTVTV